MTPGSAELRRRVRDNLARVQSSLLEAASGTPIILVCVTKYARPQWVEWLLEAGAGDLGENLLPQALEHFQQLTTAGYQFRRHLIGAQQSRKLRLIPGNFDCFQALDSIAAARRLNELCSAGALTLNVLLQINVGSERQKHGFDEPETASAVEEISASCPQLALRGLMAIPPGPQAYASPLEFEQGTRGNFERMRSLFDRIGAVENRSAGWDTLSLGMSHDYLWAIRAGATMVRIGSALFEGMEG